MLGVATALIGAASSWWTKRCDMKEAEFRTALAIEENRARLAADQMQYNHEWEMASLKSIPKGLKYASFCMFAGPVLMSMLAPFCDIELQKMWDSLNAVPEYWRQGFTCITGAIWGVAQLKDMGGLRGVLGWSGKKIEAPASAPTREDAVSRPIAHEPVSLPASEALVQEKGTQVRKTGSRAARAVRHLLDSGDSLD